MGDTFMMLRRTALESLSKSFLMTGHAQSVVQPRANTKGGLMAHGCTRTTARVIWSSEVRGSMLYKTDVQTSAFPCCFCIALFLQALFFAFKFSPSAYVVGHAQCGFSDLCQCPSLSVERRVGIADSLSFTMLWQSAKVASKVACYS